MLCNLLLLIALASLLSHWFQPIMVLIYISEQYVSEYQITEKSEHLKKSCMSDLQETTNRFCQAIASHAFKSILEGLFLPQKYNGKIDSWQQETKLLVITCWLTCSVSPEDNKLLQEKLKQCLGPSLNMLLELNNFGQEQKRILICQRDQRSSWQNWVTQKLWSSAIPIKMNSSQEVLSGFQKLVLLEYTDMTANLVPLGQQ